MSDTYILDKDGKTPIKVSVIEWSTWSHEQVVKGTDWWDIPKVTARTHYADGTHISTVFLGLDHSWLEGEGPPILWETCVFHPDGESDVRDRYDSHDAAIAGHALVELAMETEHNLTGKDRVK